MNKGLQLGDGGKSSLSSDFSLIDKAAKLLYKATKILRHYGTGVLDFLSALVPDALATFGKITQKTMAFTLAETLIVMGVIGIVSALTLPNLNSSTGDKEKVAKVKKIYQNLNDALGRAEAVYGPYSDWFVNDADATAKAKRSGERITEFMKTSKVCAMAASQGCFTSGDSKTFKNENYTNYDSQTDAYKVITADGTSVSISSLTDDYTIVVDIDGPNKGQYTLGKDVFIFCISSNGELTPVDQSGGNFSTLIGNIKEKGADAAAWIIKYDNADYLKIGNDNKCPNGTTPTEANPRCK